ncbi:MAG: 16S rRNA (cytosine(1402)-N(4))-methyltransferase RsmH [Planctomycetota bacterium]
MNASGFQHRGREDSLHQPVLVKEVLDNLLLSPGQVVIDGTVGLGGHAAAITEAIAPGGILIGIDQDQEAIRRACSNLSHAPTQVHLHHASFVEMPDLLTFHGLAQADRVLLDLGVSSLQLESPERGFSFLGDGPLDMRMDPTSGGSTAGDLVKRLSERELADLIWRYGEERQSRRIAKSIAAERQKKTIQTTGELAAIVRRAVRGRARIDKATRTFQALRIMVNDEMGELERALGMIPGILAPGGRFAVISFHSLEDRQVKYAFQAWQTQGTYEVLTRKPITASREELHRNPRSRSAKLRVLLKSFAAGPDA